MSLKVVNKLSRTLDRKILEGVLISEHNEGSLMNRKGEWGQNLPPQFSILGSDEPNKHLRKKRDRMEDQIPGDTDRQTVESSAKRVRVSRGLSNSTKSSNPSSSERSEGETQRQQPEGNQSKDDQILSSRTDLSKVKLGLQGGRIILIKPMQTGQENEQNNSQLEGSVDGQTRSEASSQGYIFEEKPQDSNNPI